MRHPMIHLNFPVSNNTTIKKKSSLSLLKISLINS